jgi:hypothetical protein
MGNAMRVARNAYSQREKKRPQNFFRGRKSLLGVRGLAKHQGIRTIEFFGISDNRQFKALREGHCGKYGTRTIIYNSATRQLKRQVPKLTQIKKLA